MYAGRRRQYSVSSLQDEQGSVFSAQSTNINEVTDPHVYKDKHRDSTCLKGFKELFDGEQLFDVTLSVDGKEFQCHRALLASSSDYFRAMFTADLAERDKKVVCINGIDSASMDLVIKYMYSGEARLHSETVQNLLSAANLFQLKDLRDGCATFMGKQLDIENCIGIHFFAQLHKCENLADEAWDVIRENFDGVAEAAEFLELNAENLVDIIKYDDLQAPEEEVFEAILEWLKHDPTNRTQHIYEVFTHVRFTLMNEYYFYDKVRGNQLLQSEPRMQPIFEEVLRNKLLRSRWVETDLPLDPRYGASYCRVIVYTCYLDDEKRQVLQLYGQRSDEVVRATDSVLIDLPDYLENPALLVTGDNELFLAGGDGTGEAFYKYCPNEGEGERGEFIRMCCNLDSPRKQFCLVEVDRTMFSVGGGTSDGNLATVSRYSHDCEEWELVAPMPKALRCFCAIGFQGKLYVFGGECEKVCKKAIRPKSELNSQTLCYNPNENTWTVLAELSTARALAGCTVYKNKIYVIGGFGTITESWIKDKSPEGCLQSVEVYDPVSNSWEQGPELPTPLCGMGVVKYHGTIYVLGGENDEDVSSSTYYLNEDHQWELKDEMVSGCETTINSCYAVMNADINDEV